MLDFCNDNSSCQSAKLNDLAGEKQTIRLSSIPSNAAIE